MQVLSRENHHDLHLTNGNDYLFAAELPLVAVGAHEVATLATIMPLAAHRHEKGWSLVGVCGLQEGQNLFVGPRGQWLGMFIPMGYRLAPFFMGRSEKGMVLCFDETSPRLGTQGQPLFDDQGEPTELLETIKNGVGAMFQGNMRASKNLEELAVNDLLVSWSPEDLPFFAKAGLHTLNAERLKELGADALGTMMQTGALDLAYGMLFSRSTMIKMRGWSRNRAAQAAKAPSLDDVFKLNDDEVFSFDSL